MRQTLFATWNNMHLVAVIFGIFLYIFYSKADDTTEESKLVITDSEVFSVNLFKNIDGLNITNNLVSSPLSAYYAISIHGILRKKDKHVEENLEFHTNNIIDHQAFQNLMNQLNNVETLKFKVINNICTTNQIKLNPEYKKLINRCLHFQTCELNVKDPHTSAKLLNNWVDENTDHIISEIIKAADITPDINMILLNAVYFQGIWKNKFKERTTKLRPFYVDQNNKNYIATMTNIDSYIYGELPDLKAKFVELPYANYNLKMIIIVPYEIDGLKSIVEHLESFNQTRLTSSGSRQNVYLMMPKFKIESSIDLKVTFEQLGMADMLKNNEGITETSNKSVLINKAIQKVVINVKEEEYDGTQNIDFFTDKMKRIQSMIAVNRPFLFKIIDDQTKMTLFIGFVANP